MLHSIFKALLTKFRPTAPVLFTALIASSSWAQTAVLHFPTDQHRLTERSTDALDSLMALYARDNLQIEIVGHADNTGRSDYNNFLSKKRANSVQNYLSNRGWSNASYALTRHGSDRPVADNKTIEGRAQNRRVEIKVNGTLLVDLSEIKDEENLRTILVEAQEPKSNFRIVKGPKGISCHIPECAFPNHDINEIEFRMVEVRTTEDMVESGFNTETEDGQCLSSAGMVSIRPFFQGKELTDPPACPYEIRIPAPKNDPRMKVYDLNEKGTWNVSATPLTYSGGGGSGPGNSNGPGLNGAYGSGMGFYTINAASWGGFNVDALIPELPVPDPAALILSMWEATRSLWREDGVVIKTKRVRGADVQMTYAATNSMVEGERFKPKKHRFKVRCSRNPEEAEIAVWERTSRREKELLTYQEMAVVKYSKFRNLYIVDYRGIRDQSSISMK